MAHTISLPIANKNIEALLLWRNPKQSGIVFGVITLTYIVLEWSKSVLSLLANAALVVVVSTFLYNSVANFTNRPGVPLPAVLKEGVKEADIKAFAERATGSINAVLGFVSRVATGKEVFLTLEVSLALYTIGKVSRWFSALGVVYLVSFIAFSLPKLYELKKDEIDSVYHKVTSVVKDAYVKHAEPYLKKIPKASTATATSPQVEKKSQ